MIGLLIPLFWTSGDVSSGFQSQSGKPYLHLVEAFPKIHLWCDTCRPFDCQRGGRSLFPHTCVSVEIFTYLTQELNKKEEVITMRENNDTIKHRPTKVQQQTLNLSTPSGQKSIRVFVQLP